MCQSMTFLMGIEPATRDNSAVFMHIRVIENDLKELLRAVVDDMRDSGASWTDVGEALGMSRQAAWEKFSSECPAVPRPAKGPGAT